jgi:hypothetical protein
VFSVERYEEIEQMRFSQIAVLAGLVLGGLAVQAGSASALPMIDTGPAVVAHSEAATGIQEARWHGYYGFHRRYWHPGYGWHHRWHRHYGWRHHYGWHRGWGWHRRYWG